MQTTQSKLGAIFYFTPLSLSDGVVRVNDHFTDSQPGSQQLKRSDYPRAAGCRPPGLRCGRPLHELPVRRRESSITAAPPSRKGASRIARWPGCTRRDDGGQPQQKRPRVDGGVQRSGGREVQHELVRRSSIFQPRWTSAAGAMLAAGLASAESVDVNPTADELDPGLDGALLPRADRRLVKSATVLVKVALVHPGSSDICYQSAVC